MSEPSYPRLETKGTDLSRFVRKIKQSGKSFTERFNIFDPGFPKSKLTSPSCSKAIKTIEDNPRDITTVSQHGVWSVLLAFRAKMTRHGRRHNSVWGLPSRAWEATRRVFSGMTRVSRRHRSRYENGDEQTGQNMPPSVVLSELRIKTTMKTRMDRTTGHCNNCVEDSANVFVSCSEVWAKRPIDWMNNSLHFLFFSSEDTESTRHCKVYVIIENLSSVRSHSHQNFDSQLRQ